MLISNFKMSKYVYFIKFCVIFGKLASYEMGCEIISQKDPKNGVFCEMISQLFRFQSMFQGLKSVAQPL